MRILAAFLADESAATAIEYAMIASIISISIVVAVNGIGTTVNAIFTHLSTLLK